MTSSALKPFVFVVLVPCFSPVVPVLVPIVVPTPVLLPLPLPLPLVPVVFVIAAETFAGVAVFTSAPAPAPAPPACVPAVPLLPPPLVVAAGFPAPLPRPRSAHGLLTGGGAGTGPDIAGAGVEDADDDVVGNAVLGRLVEVVFEAEFEVELAFEETMAERSRELGVDEDVLEVDGAGERIWEELGVRQLCERRGVSGGIGDGWRGGKGGGGTLWVGG